MDGYELPIIERFEVAEGTMAFRFDRRGTDFTFEAGQHADFTLADPPETDAEGNRRTFSLTGSPNDRDAIMIATRMRPTAFKNSLKVIPLGTKVNASPATGSMTLHEDGQRPAVFIAGGIGITPFRSMIAWATEEQLPHQITLVYSNRTPAATAFREDLERWAGQNPNLHLALTVTETPDGAWPYRTGMVNDAFLRGCIADLATPWYYLAGPPGMVVALRKVLLSLGVSKDAIRLESFTGYPVG